MPLIQVRDVPEHIYRRLVQGAEHERRSLPQQVVAVLAHGLDVEIDPKARRRRLLRTIVDVPSEAVGRLTDPARAVRADRTR